MSAPYDPDARYPDARAQQPSSDPRIAQIQSVSVEFHASIPTTSPRSIFRGPRDYERRAAREISLAPSYVRP